MPKRTKTEGEKKRELNLRPARSAPKQKIRGSRGTMPVPPAGRRLSPAMMAQRDMLMIQRKAEGKSVRQIAAEAHLSVRQARDCLRRAEQEGVQFRMSDDPAVIVERTFESFQRTVTVFELIATEALANGQLANAIGAKKGAMEAAEKVLALLQMTGRMPQDLSALRHLIDLRAIAVRTLDAMDAFEREMYLVLRLEDPDERAAAARECVGRVRVTFHELIGLEPEQEAVEGTGRELSA